MYPYVNRIQSETVLINDLYYTFEPIFRDGNDLPIHGMYANAQRKIQT
jgi:hypothetical protein